MACYYPITAWRVNNPSLPVRPLHFTKIAGYEELQVPCGQCIGCRLERSRQWAIRCVFEASLYKRNCFVTLTYAPENSETINKGGKLTLNKRDFVLWMKRLRKAAHVGIRYYHCGEYGEVCRGCGLSIPRCVCGPRRSFERPGLGRPHHHVCLFNYDFSDKVFFRKRGGVTLYTSASLEALWPYGFSTVGDVTFESAAYVARYCTKKITGVDLEGHYDGRVPEYTTMSRRPGLASTWFYLFADDVLSTDSVVIRNGLRCRPPAFYNNMVKGFDKELYRGIQAKRREAYDLEDNRPCRLRVKEYIARSRSLNKRTYENGCD